MEMSANQLVELTGLNDRTIRKRLKPLTPVRSDGRANFYDTKEALKLLYPTHAAEMQRETLLLERARREKTEIEVGEMRRALVPVTEITKTLDNEYSFIRAQLRSIPSKMAKPLSMASDPNEVFTLLSEVINECLSELTADAKYKLEEDRLNAARISSTQVANDGSTADSEIDGSGVGGPEEISES